VLSTRAIPSQQRWDLNHKPGRRPLGCNGKYGQSGYKAHKRKAQKVCPRCRSSLNHWRREKARGGIKPTLPQPCGTHAAYERHRAAGLRGAEIDLACRVAEANYRAELRAKNP
jgi:hypothetical protein